MNWLERQLERLRSIDPRVLDGVLAAVLLLASVSSVYLQEVREGMSEPPVGALATILLVTAPVAVRRVRPLEATVVGCAGIAAHIIADWPEGTLPLAMGLLTYTVAAWDAPRRAALGLVAVYVTLVTLGLADTPGLDTLGVVANMAIFTVAWTVGYALRARRETLDVRLREAEERAEAERQGAARALAEERLRIAQELHDVVAHSMSVIAVQAGAGAHVLTDRPEQARAALEAISETSRGTLTELRRLLGVLRDDDGALAHAPAPGLADLPRLVDDVRSAGVPVELTLSGTPTGEHTGVELSAYRVVQEALTNVIKHAGSPTEVQVRVERRPDCLVVEVVDDGRGAAANGSTDDRPGGHGLLGMRERVELWGGELTVGPVAGGGYRVRAQLPLDAAP